MGRKKTAKQKTTLWYDCLYSPKVGRYMEQSTKNSIRVGALVFRQAMLLGRNRMITRHLKRDTLCIATDRQTRRSLIFFGSELFKPEIIAHIFSEANTSAIHSSAATKGDGDE